jgi:hypothetical protein
MGIAPVSLKNISGGAIPQQKTCIPAKYGLLWFRLGANVYWKPQVDPGSQIGTGLALLLLATMVVFGVVAVDLEASMWSAAKPVISIPRTRARTAIFMVGVLLVTMYFYLALGALDMFEYTD